MKRDLKYFILEYNTEQGAFHHNHYGLHMIEKNSYGWFSVIERCTDSIGYLFEMFIERDFNKNYTKKYLIEKAIRFKKNLEEMERLGFEIIHRGEKVTSDFIIPE